MTDIMFSIISFIIFCVLILIALCEVERKNDGSSLNYSNNEIKEMEDCQYNHNDNVSNSGTTFFLLIVIILLVAILHELNPDFLQDFQFWLKELMKQ